MPHPKDIRYEIHFSECIDSENYPFYDVKMEEIGEVWAKEIAEQADTIEWMDDITPDTELEEMMNDPEFLNWVNCTQLEMSREKKCPFPDVDITMEDIGETWANNIAENADKIKWMNYNPEYLFEEYKWDEDVSEYSADEFTEPFIEWVYNGADLYELSLIEWGDLLAEEVAKKADTIEWRGITTPKSAISETFIESEGTQYQDTIHELFVQDENGNTLKGYLKISSERSLKACILGSDRKTPLTDSIDIPYVDEFEHVLKGPIMDVLDIPEAETASSISNIYKQVKTHLRIIARTSFHSTNV